MKQTHDGVAQISGVDRIDERAWIGTRKRDSVLSDDVPVNHPGGVVFLREELIAATLDTGMAIAGPSRIRQILLRAGNGQ